MSVTDAAISASKVSYASIFTTNPLLVGSTWTLSSSIFTTFFTTAFLKYDANKTKKQKDGNDFSKRNYQVAMGDASLPSQPEVQMGFLKQLNIARPQLLTLYRFFGSTLLGIIVNSNVLGIFGRIRDTAAAMRHFAFPAVFLFCANYFNTIALNRIGISLTYTSKCCIPLITVILSLCVNGVESLPSPLSLFSLIPIAIGVAMASWNSPVFEKTGFLVAMISATSQASLNVCSKSVLRKTGIGGLEAQRAMAAVASIIAISSVMVTNSNLFGRKAADEIKVVNGYNGRNAKIMGSHVTLPSSPPNWLSLGAVLAYHCEYVLSFMFVKLVEPVTYGTCDSIRRLLIIVLGRQMFGGEAFSVWNFVGIGLALIGALGYSVGAVK